MTWTKRTPETDGFSVIPDSGFDWFQSGWFSTGWFIGKDVFAAVAKVVTSWTGIVKETAGWTKTAAKTDGWTKI